MANADAACRLLAAFRRSQSCRFGRVVRILRRAMQRCTQWLLRCRVCGFQRVAFAVVAVDSISACTVSIVARRIGLSLLRSSGARRSESTGKIVRSIGVPSASNMSAGKFSNSPRAKRTRRSRSAGGCHALREVRRCVRIIAEQVQADGRMVVGSAVEHAPMRQGWNASSTLPPPRRCGVRAAAPIAARAEERWCCLSASSTSRFLGCADFIIDTETLCGLLSRVHAVATRFGDKTRSFLRCARALRPCSRCRLLRCATVSRGRFD